MTAIVGLTLDDKVPNVYAQALYAQGPRSTAQTLNCILTGNKLSGGTAANGSITRITTNEEADTYFGARSELANMCRAALLIVGVELWAGVVASTGASATITVTFATTAGSAGTFRYRFDGRWIEVYIPKDTTATAAGDLFVAVWNAFDNGRLAGLASNSTGTVTITIQTPGLRGNQYNIYVDRTLAPSAMTSVATGDTAYADGAIPAVGGSGQDDVTTLLTAMAPTWYNYAGCAHNDAANEALIEIHANTVAGPLVGHPMNYVVALNSILQSTAESFGINTMNDVVGQLLYLQFSSTHPSRIAATVAALRSVTEGQAPNPRYNGMAVPGIGTHLRDADSPTHANLKQMLNSGVTPLETADDDVVITRAITTRCRDAGGLADYRTLDVGQAIVPQTIMYRAKLKGLDLQQANAAAGPDNTDGTLPRNGVQTPRITDNAMLKIAKDAEEAPLAGLAPLLVDVSSDPPVTVWDSVTKRLLTDFPCHVAPLNHQHGITVLQK